MKYEKGRRSIIRINRMARRRKTRSRRRKIRVKGEKEMSIKSK
jgi:hypothetical protein